MATLHVQRSHFLSVLNPFFNYYCYRYFIADWLTKRAVGLALWDGVLSLRRFGKRPWNFIGVFFCDFYHTFVLKKCIKAPDDLRVLTKINLQASSKI